jgi:hypothetical protein
MGQDNFHLDQNWPRGQAASEDDCEALRALIPAYSLGATDPAETHYVESLLDRCPEVAAELAAYKATAEKLLHSAPPATAPAHLREKVLMSVRSTSSSDTTSALRTRYSWRPSVVAAAVVIALLSFSNIYWATQISALQNSQQTIARELDDHADVLTLIGAEETQRIELWNPNHTIRAVMLCNPDEPLGFVYAEDFPPLSPGMAYQLWLIRGHQRTSAGSFVVDENGEGAFVFRASEPIGHYHSVEITSETANASQPNSHALVRGLLNYE